MTRPSWWGLLMQLDLDQRIPVRLYQVIAELLVWLQAMNTEDESVSN
jgi:flagellar biosynthesis protein